jgi:guanylate kinase
LRESGQTKPTRPEAQPPRRLLVVLSGPSGVGKGTVVNRAIAARRKTAGRLKRSVSVTTRPQRGEERQGRDYFFCTPEEFNRKAAAGQLLEWASYLGNSYGTPAEWVDRQLATGYDVVLEIEVQGARQVKERRPNAVLIYMLPPSWRALRQRLRRRRSESEEIQGQRLAVARQEMRAIRHYDYLIVNDRADRAAREFLTILAAERARVTRADLSSWLDEETIA